MTRVPALRRAAQPLSGSAVIVSGSAVIAATLAWLLASSLASVVEGATASSSSPSPAASPTTGYAPGPLLNRFLAGPMAGVEEIVFAVRVPGRDHWYVNFGNYSVKPHGLYGEPFKFEDGVFWGYGEGGRLCRLNLRTGKLTALIDDPQGGVRDPQVHYDGRKILFSYRKGGNHTYHLYEINVDGTGLRQLTDGPDDDIEPIYCPDGSIVFCSSRCRRFVNCWYSRVATLYRCDADGKNIRMISSNNDHDNTPWMLPDGRILYMRWEYVDRSQIDFHHLWTMNPDGTGQMTFFGNEKPGTAYLDAKPIPGSRRIATIASPGHGMPEHTGPIGLLDPNRGPDAAGVFQQVSKAPNIWAAPWRDPFPFSEDAFLAAAGADLLVIDGSGNTETIYRLPAGERARLQCHEPRPIVPRSREPIRPERTDLSKATGRVVLSDIYHGRNMAGVKRGSIKKLLVLQQLPKPINFSGGMEPLTIGGSFTLAQIVGTIPVEPDGSANAELPALKSLFFVALDENNVSVKRMHSFTVLQPGETLGCVGCHEQRNEAPRFTADLAALKRAPSRAEPIRDIPDVLDYPRDIQPILDKHCASCHRPERYEGRVDLTGDKTSTYTMSYWTMQTRGLVVDGRNQPHGNRPPYSYGSATSRLLKLASGGHHGVQVSNHELRMLQLWIDTSATYPGTYASLMSGQHHVHTPHEPLLQRCGGCHSQEVNDPYGRRRVPVFSGPSGTRCETAYNISRPEQSLALLAPLAKEAGGLALCKEMVFKDKNDPLFQLILESVRNAHARLEAGKRFDMPGFRPNEHYLREMQRFGFLPNDLKPTDPIDVYAAERAYWQSFDYHPQATGGTTPASVQ